MYFLFRPVLLCGVWTGVKIVLLCAWTGLENAWIIMYLENEIIPTHEN
jgi:hypothetical protein